MKRLLPLALAASLVLAAPATAATKPKFAVALGDSFSAGVQPGPNQRRSYSYPKESYTNQMLSRASKLLKVPLKLEMLACGGATTPSMGGFEIKPCDTGVGGFKLPYANTSPRTSQLRYALQFLRSHRGQVAFVTMTMGGNNLLRCVDSATGGFDLNCITGSYDSINHDLPLITRRLRRAAGPGVPLLGSGYPDPYLQFYLRGPDQQAIAAASVPVQQQLNNTLQQVYQSTGWRFVNVDGVFQTNTPLDQTTNLDPYGQVPVSVAMICEMTWMCAPAPQGPNIHPNHAGYAAYSSANLSVLKKATR
jgi:hypothetical protein